MKLPRIGRLSVPDPDDLHVYGGLLLLAAGGWLVAPALGMAIAGAGMLALGLLYSLESARRATRHPAPRRFDAEPLMTTTPPAADEAA